MIYFLMTVLFSVAMIIGINTITDIIKIAVADFHSDNDDSKE